MAEGQVRTKGSPQNRGLSTQSSCTPFRSGTTCPRTHGHFFPFFPSSSFSLSFPPLRFLFHSLLLVFSFFVANIRLSAPLSRIFYTLTTSRTLFFFSELLQSPSHRLAKSSLLVLAFEIMKNQLKHIRASSPWLGILISVALGKTDDNCPCHEPRCICILACPKRIIHQIQSRLYKVDTRDHFCQIFIWALL